MPAETMPETNIESSAKNENEEMKGTKSRRTDVRVALLSPTLARGDYWQPICREITRQLPNTVVFTSNWPGFVPGFEDKFKVQALSGYKYFTLKRTSTGGEIGIIWAPPSILWRLKRFRPDVIFVSAFGVWTLYSLLYKALTGCRVIIAWDGNSATTTYLDRPIRLRVRRIMARFADAVLTNTHEGLEYLHTALGMPRSKLVRQPYQVPDAIALRVRDAMPIEFRRRPVFLFVGRIIKSKGWRYLIEATTRLKLQVGPCFSVVVVGSGEELDELRRLVGERDLADIVRVEGFILYQDVGRYFRACDVFVLPTLEDVWAVVVLEAMAFGKAVVCSKYAGAREMVQHGANGYIFDPFHGNELFDYMQRFIQRPELAAKFGAKSSEILAPYTPERAATALVDIVQKVVDGGHRGCDQSLVAVKES